MSCCDAQDDDDVGHHRWLPLARLTAGEAPRGFCELLAKWWYGLRVGRPSRVRDAVARLIAASDRHDWSAEEVLAALDAHGVAADASSVFRALVRLEGDGALARVELGDGRARYEAAGAHHEHVRCERCGVVAGVPGCVVEPLRPAVEQATGFRVTGHHLLFWGVCRACRAPSG